MPKIVPTLQEVLGVHGGQYVNFPFLPKKLAKRKPCAHYLREVGAVTLLTDAGLQRLQSGVVAPTPVAARPKQSSKSTPRLVSSDKPPQPVLCLGSASLGLRRYSNVEVRRNELDTCVTL